VLLHAENITKYIQEKLLFSIEKIQISEGDRIGLIGDNGSGKTTLLNILAGTEPSNHGQLSCRCGISYIRQFSVDEEIVWGQLANTFGLRREQRSDQRSGGEAAKARIVNSLETQRPLVFADEPTSNLDAESVELFYEAFHRLRTFVIVSHDRALLDRLCNRIWELRNETLTVYSGNYSAYLECRELAEKTAWREYEQYVSEKTRLKRIAREKRSAAEKIVKKPRDRGQISSERFTSRSKGGQQKALQRQAKSIEKHIDMLDVRERPYTAPVPRMDFNRTDPPGNKIIIRAEGLTFAYHPARPVFSNTSFMIENNQRTALTGKNGCGKTTLLNLLYQGNEAITCAPKVKLGYFKQRFSQLDGTRTVYENILRVSVQPVSVTRTMLARMLFFWDDLQKPVSVLSGGEKVRLALTMIFLSDANVLLLDEPTNYLDIRSLQALEDVLTAYPGAVLFASHDRRFTETVATRAAQIADGQVKLRP
jgi:macrolide transport system ATP-binding/permease protein